MRRKVFYVLAAPLAAVGVALVISSIVLLFAGSNPLTAYSNMWEFGTRLETLIATLNRATPLYLSGVAVAIGFRMNLFNIGVEGQYILAAIVAAKVGAEINLPPVLHVTVIIVTAMIVGAFWAGIAGYLKVTRNVHEVISTIMLNAIAVSGVVSYLLGVWDVPDESLDTALPAIPESGWMPPLNGLVELFTREIQRVELWGFLLVAVAVGIVYHYLINRTRIGFDLRASGENPTAAEASGTDPKRMIMAAMLLGGAVAGLVGLPELLGDSHAYNLRFTRNLGFNGIAVALLGRNHPVGIAIGAFVIGWLDRASGVLEVRGDAPREIVAIMTGVIILAAVVAYAIVERKRRAEEAAAAAAATAAAKEELEAWQNQQEVGDGEGGGS
ncbi:MAG: ABC transporter permease [Acidimicrobiia bacterium]|nr:ABC transporter permease [Acidimicrobiia bacterium]